MKKKKNVYVAGHQLYVFLIVVSYKMIESEVTGGSAVVQAR